MGDEGNQLSTVVQNPLLFDHIVERVISFVDLDSLPSCRLVNRQWEKFALPKLLQNLHKFPVVIPGKENATVDDFNAKMYRYFCYKAEEPQPGLIFRNFTLSLEQGSAAPIVNSFISRCGSEITELRLQFKETYESPFLLKRWMMGSLVNLKTLTLEVDTTFKFWYPNANQNEWWLQDYPKSNLKRLCLIYNKASCTKDGPPLMLLNNLIELLGSCESLEEIYIGDGIPWWHLKLFLIPRILEQRPNVLLEISVGEMNSACLKVLSDLEDFENLKLKVLKCKSLELLDGDRRFSGFLERYKNNLESVVVGEVKTRRERGMEKTEARGIDIDIIFPELMPKLKVFQTGLPVEQTGRIYFPPVNFPVQLPSLEKLFLYDGNTENESKDPDDWEYLRVFLYVSDPHPNLTELRLPFVSSALRNTAGAVFPELRSLKMETGLDESLHEIWAMWPHLKSLDLTLNGDRKTRRKKRVENFITGIRTEGTQGSSKDADSNLPSIANLKDLKHLKLRLIGDCGGSLTDFSVSRAFCKLPCLEFLLLSHHNISEEGTKKLLKYHPLLKKVDCPVHPEVYKIQREYLPNDFIPSDFSTDTTEDSVRCDCSFLK